MKIQRASRAADRMMVPKYADEPGCVVVDSTWGQIQPLEVAPGVQTIAELDVIEHLQAGLPIIDTRHDEQHQQATIPGARGIPHEEIVERVDELDRDQVTVLFCNGPQCKATPDAVQALLEHGYPADKLRYYRGGIHDWMTLGLPIRGSRAQGRPDRRPAHGGQWGA
jgi:rhodanese-related sulfurtransferase